MCSKLETGAETDDSDPYVCFRRREVRQVRKTRGRDAHSAEKLKKLRKELEEARQIMALIRQREIIKREQLAIEKQLFEQRSSLRQVKRNLPEQYKEGDEDLLINQKPQKKKLLDLSAQRPTAPQLRMPQRPDGRFADVDLVLLQDVLADKERQIQEDIENRIAQHKQRSEGYLDMTRVPLTPPLEESAGRASEQQQLNTCRHLRHRYRRSTLGTLLLRLACPGRPRIRLLRSGMHLHRMTDLTGLSLHFDGGLAEEVD